MIGSKFQQMKLISTDIGGVFIVENFDFKDERGRFVKAFNQNLFLKHNIIFESKEIYYSISNKDVIRGMHFQLPPFEHAKLIYVTSGSIIDVVLDIRVNSETYGRLISIGLEAHKNSIYVPIGCAHGFKSLKDDTTVVYNQTTCYSKEHDCGILWNSFNFNWNTNNPIISERDKQFKPFNDFTSPF